MEEHDYRVSAARGEYEWGTAEVGGLGDGAAGDVWGYGEDRVGGGACDDF